MAEQEIGLVTHYYDRIEVAAIRVTKGDLSTGDKIHFNGHGTDFEQVVGSMQIDHAAVTKAKPGDEIGLKVDERVHEHDRVFKVVD